MPTVSLNMESTLTYMYVCPLQNKNSINCIGIAQSVRISPFLLARHPFDLTCGDGDQSNEKCKQDLTQRTALGRCDFLFQFLRFPLSFVLRIPIASRVRLGSAFASAVGHARFSPLTHFLCCMEFCREKKET